MELTKDFTTSRNYDNSTTNDIDIGKIMLEKISTQVLKKFPIPKDKYLSKFLLFTNCDYLKNKFKI